MAMGRPKAVLVLDAELREQLESCERDNLSAWKRNCMQQLRCSRDKAIQSVHTSATVRYGFR